MKTLSRAEIRKAWNQQEKGRKVIGVLTGTSGHGTLIYCKEADLPELDKYLIYAAEQKRMAKRARAFYNDCARRIPRARRTGGVV